VANAPAVTPASLPGGVAGVGGIGGVGGIAGVEEVVVAPATSTPRTLFTVREARDASDAKAPIVLASRAGVVPIAKLPIYREQPKPTSAESLTIVTRGKIRSGESLGSSLRRQGISPGTVHLVASEMREIFDFRYSRPGDEYRLGQDSEGRVLDFRYSQNSEESFYLAWNGTRYVVRKEIAELRPQMAKIAGIVDSSFYGAVLALGEQSVLASEFANILAWDIDFSRSVHPGDEFQILYERLYRINDDGEEVYVRPGRIFAGRYDGRSGEHTVVYFEGADGTGAYFRPDGSSVERAFLVSPLESSRITSRFTWARQHPILKITRPHPGIDYAAPRGTPIWSVADGVVEYKARAGASGNLIRVRHQGGLTSHYAHLASFAQDLKVGDRVEQKEIIGYVGSTGLSTGPHVCFRVKRDGRYIDPMKISAPAGEPVDVTRLAVFRSVRDQLLADLGPGPLHLADEAL
jgi:murein DD-endopeptidase MepM/ murein hydrolase activator NlpD